LPAFGSNRLDIFEEGNCTLTVNSKIRSVLLVTLEVGADEKDGEIRILLSRRSAHYMFITDV
jgi:hypothetical protein